MTKRSLVEREPIADAWRGKTALITGSTRGLGRTIAEELASRGVTVIISGRSGADVDRALGDLAEAGYAAAGFAADLAKPDQAHRLAEQVIETVGSLDILVNNAGMSIRGNFWDVTDRDWDEQVNVNYRAPFILAQHAARNMIANGVRGRIINVGTIGARRCHRNACVYDSGKGGVEVITRNMAYELAPHGISVNCVVPGAIPIRPGSAFDPAESQDYLRHVPFGRFGHSNDIAAVVLFFCAPESEFTTGQSLLVDGAHATYLPIG